MKHDPTTQKSLLTRLKRIEGQVRGLQRMVEEERYCADILTQIASVEQALSGVSKLILRDHLGHCVTEAIQSGDPDKANEKFDELVQLFDRHG